MCLLGCNYFMSGHGRKVKGRVIVETCLSQPVLACGTVSQTEYVWHSQVIIPVQM